MTDESSPEPSPTVRVPIVTGYPAVLVNRNIQLIGALNGFTARGAGNANMTVVGYDF